MAKKPIKKKPEKDLPKSQKTKIDVKKTVDESSGFLADCLAGKKSSAKLSPPVQFKIEVEDKPEVVLDELTKTLQPFGNRDFSRNKITSESSITDVDQKFGSIAFKLSSRIDALDSGLINLRQRFDSAIGQLNKKYEADHASSVATYRKLEAQLSDIKKSEYGQGGLITKGGQKITSGGSSIVSGSDLAALALLVFPHLKKNYLDPFFAKYEKEIGDITNSIADNRAEIQAARKAARMTSGAITAGRTVAKGVGSAVKAVTPTRTPVAPKTPTPKTYGTPGTTTSFSGAPQQTPVPTAKPKLKKVPLDVLTKIVNNKLTRAMGSALLRKLPAIGLAAALIDAGVRIGRGDRQGAALAAGSGATGLLPGIGTAASFGFDAALISHDVFREMHNRDPDFSNPEDVKEIGRIYSAMATFTRAKEEHVKAEVAKANNQALRQSDEKTFMAAMAKTGQMRRGQYTGMEMDEQVASTTQGGYLFGMIGGKRVPGKTVTLDQNRQVPAYDMNMGRMNLGAKGVPGTAAGSSNYMAQFAGSAGITTPPLPMQRQMAMMPPLPAMKPQPLSFASNSFRERVYQQKSQFMQFGALPSGFENVMGNRGILGKPMMVAASGAQPFGGGFSGGSGGPAYSGIPGGSGLASPGTAPAGGTGGTEFSSDQLSGAGKQSHAGLAKQRTELFGKEMLNDNVVREIAALKKIEVGGMGQGAESDWLESYVNGAVVRRTSLMGRLQGKHRAYWAKIGGQHKVTDAEMERTRQQLMSVVKQGRNVTKGATDNASAGVARNRIRKLTREGRANQLYHTQNKSGRKGELLYVDSYLFKRQQAMMKQADDYQKQIEKQQQEKANAQQKAVAKGEAVAAAKDMGPGYDDFGPSAGTATDSRFRALNNLEKHLTDAEVMPDDLIVGTKVAPGTPDTITDLSQGLNGRPVHSLDATQAERDRILAGLRAAKQRNTNNSMTDPLTGRLGVGKMHLGASGSGVEGNRVRTLTREDIRQANLRRTRHIPGQVRFEGSQGLGSFRAATGGRTYSMPYGYHRASSEMRSGPKLSRLFYGMSSGMDLGRGRGGGANVIGIGGAAGRMYDPLQRRMRTEIQAHPAIGGAGLNEQGLKKLISSGCLAIQPNQYKNFIAAYRQYHKENDGKVWLKFMPAPEGQPHEFVFTNKPPGKEFSVDQAIGNWKRSGDIDPSTATLRQQAVERMSTQEQKEYIRTRNMIPQKSTMVSKFDPSDKTSSMDDIPKSVQDMRIKTADGKTTTLGELGVTKYSELHKKGGQAFAGGRFGTYNDPNVTFLGGEIQRILGPAFNRITAQNDAFHHGKYAERYKSQHLKGTKLDFTLKGDYKTSVNLLTKQMKEEFGLIEGKHYRIHRNYDHGTGRHVDLGVTPAGLAMLEQIRQERNIGSIEGVLNDLTPANVIAEEADMLEAATIASHDSFALTTAQGFVGPTAAADALNVIRAQEAATKSDMITGATGPESMAVTSLPTGGVGAELDIGASGPTRVVQPSSSSPLDIGAKPVSVPTPPPPSNDAKSAITAMADVEDKIQTKEVATKEAKKEDTEKAKDNDSKNSSRTRSAGGQRGSGQHHPEQEAPRAGSSGYGASGRCWV